MSKSGLRRIKVSGETYLWKVGHYHLKEFEFSECADRVTIYLEGFKNSPLILHFRLEDNTLLQENGSNKENWFIDGGCFIKNKEVINLNRPGVIAKLIEYHAQRNWNPKKENKALEVQNALKLLEIIEFPEGMN